MLLATLWTCLILIQCPLSLGNADSLCYRWEAFILRRGRPKSNSCPCGEEGISEDSTTSLPNDLHNQTQSYGHPPDTGKTPQANQESPLETEPEAGEDSYKSRNTRPWMVFIQINIDPSRGRIAVCGGSLLNHRFVLTAAHCICNQTTCQVGADETSELNSGQQHEPGTKRNPKAGIHVEQHPPPTVEPEPGQQKGRMHPLFNINERFQIQIGVSNRLLSHLYPNRTYGVSRVVIHPSYQISDLASPHDLALLRLDRSVEFIKHVIAPICLPGGSGFGAESGPGLASVAGWGAKEDAACLTEWGGPSPFHQCKFPFVFANNIYSHCTFAESPSFKDPLCQEFFRQQEDGDLGHVHYANIKIKLANDTFHSCWQAPQATFSDAHHCRTGEYGWCGVCSDDQHCSEVNVTSSQVQWGFCAASCTAQSQDSPKEVFTDHLNEVTDLRVLESGKCQELAHKDLKYHPENDLCAARIETLDGGHEEPVFRMGLTESGQLRFQRDKAIWVPPRYFYGGGDACSGDSGSPLWKWVGSNPSRAVIIGVVSRGVGCARFNRPGIYTRVRAYRSWIQANIKEGDCSPKRLRKFIVQVQDVMPNHGAENEE
ncbi:uncharacterized protein LOC131885820 [Tigriopus californicus]|uniref:uncharacterized protein LOC131885820 n=1 Tax=Tigriopus californicus TaxID=6832 RepID=UPI0027DA3880|nr:uncharacterized protein LOC131885820 [Tigriopus californicus]